MLTQSLCVKEPFAVWEGRLKGPVGARSGALWCRNDIYLGSSPLRTPFFISGKSLLGKDGAQTQFNSSLIASWQSNTALTQAQSGSEPN